ncbi:MAG: hypothetical protein DMG65_21395 [Candidatus Angelobacter sp. Gp1-AA117]|nr:MAG: hypothetical protein DMG65_21395 [Candidatus Angelobacter sp. Gp1-AA117]
MSSRVEQVAIFVVMSVLVTLFTWIYLRSREKYVQFWMLGWIAVFLHFTAQLAGTFGLLHWPWLFFFRVSTIQLAGVCFVLSVSNVFATPGRRLLYLLTVGVPAVLCTAMLNMPPVHPWIFATLILFSTLVAIGQSLIHYGSRAAYFQVLLFTLLPYTLWCAWRALDEPRIALPCYLTSFYVTAALLYWRQHRRLTPGTVTTTAAFLLWSAQFHLSNILESRHLLSSEPNIFFDMPKYFVAVGMILTLYENETSLAKKVAQRYRTLFEENMAAVYVSTLNGHLLECNSAFQKMYGCSKEELLAMPANSLYLEPDEYQQFLQRLKEDGQVINHEYRQRRKDGSQFWILERATIVTDSAGRKVIEGTAIDITERKHAELALKQSEERFSTIFRHSPVGCGIVSTEGVFLNVNDALVKMFGLPAEQVVGRTGVDLGLWKSQEERDNFYRRLRAEGSIKNMEIEFKDAAGNRHVCLYYGTIVRIGEQECIFGMQLDLTEQRALETKFLQAQKMEALGRLAGGVAHDFNNLLGVICSYAELLESRLGNNETFKRYCEKIIETTQRAGALTSQLLTFSRKEIARPVPLRLNKEVRDLASILSRLIGEDIEMRLDLRATGTVTIDKTHFEQVLFNLVVNARDAMPGGGELTVRTENRYRAVLHSLNGAEVSQYLSISITDTGVGMDEETCMRAFEPLFTTKPAGRGTGLGLATVYTIVQQCGGDINIKSRPNHGTTVTVLLPSGDEVDLPKHCTVISQPVRGNGHILLVEDETELRNASAEFLTSLGYTVLCAGSGPEALRLANQKENIDLVISDVVMPRMNGREFTDCLLQTRPNIKLLFISGYADDVVLQAGISMSGTPFLQKPFSLRQLGSKVHELLSS